MSMSQRGALTDDDRRRLLEAKTASEEAETIRAHYRSVCVEMMAKSSIRVVAELTGVSTNTLQRWKRDLQG